MDYHFVSPERFQALRDAGPVFGMFRGLWPGILVRHAVERGPCGHPGREVGRVEYRRPRRGGRDGAVRRRDHDFRRPSSLEELRRRLELRGTDTPEEIEKRLQRAQYELGQAHQYRYQVVNDDLDRAVNEICTILTEEKEKERND